MKRVLVSLLYFSIAAIAAGPLYADSSARLAEDAATEARRSQDTLEKLRANEPFTSEPRVLRRFEDAEERAERSVDRATLKAAGAERDAARAARQKSRLDRARKLRQHRTEQKRMRRRRLDRGE